MKRGLLTFLFTSSLAFLFGQNMSDEYFWVKFKDKNSDGYSLSNPGQFLSQKSITRRSIQGIAIDSTDLPITQSYIDSITPFTTQLVHRLKWFNMVIVQMPDSTNIDSIKRFPFVDSVATIITYPYKSLQAQNKFESLTPVVNQQYIYPDIHGAAYHQINMMNADLLHQLGYKGDSMLIALMDNGDNGIDTIHAFDSVRPRILDTWNFVTDQRSILNDPLGGHGTCTFSCMAANMPNQYVGSAPEASFVLFQTEDIMPSGFWKNIIGLLLQKGRIAREFRFSAPH
jgi:serine protease AprX